MKVAVVGGGVFGCTAAVELGQAGHSVDLFERHRDLLMGASRCNQGRLHRGYHYPRSQETAQACRRSADEFGRRFPSVVWRDGYHYYALAREGSKTTPNRYRAFLEDLDLWAVEAWPLVLSGDNVDLCVQVPESLIDLDRLRVQLWRELGQAGVKVHLETQRMWGGYDWLVDATYTQTFTAMVCAYTDLRVRRYEVCEVALVGLPQEFRGVSLVVLDGPFCSLDPVPGRDYHMLYDVEHSVHHATVGRLPDTPPELFELLDKPPSRHVPSNARKMVETAERYMPAIRKATYLGSVFTIRSVPADVESTDARPTLVERRGNVVTVLGGKLDTCLGAARKVVFEVNEAAALTHANVVPRN